MIRVSGYSVGRVGKEFIDDDVAPRVSGESHGHRIAVYRVSSDYKINDPGAPQVRWHKHVNLIKPWNGWRLDD